MVVTCGCGPVQNLKEFDIDHSYGEKARRQFLGELTGTATPHGERVQNERYTGKDGDELKMVYRPTITPPEVNTRLLCFCCCFRLYTAASIAYRINTEYRAAANVRPGPTTPNSNPS